MSDQTYQRDDEGNIIDPPTLSQHERAINDAAAAGDQAALDRAQRAYDEERMEVVAEVEAASEQDGDGDPVDNIEDTGGNPDTGDDEQDRDSAVADLADNNTLDSLQDQARERGLSVSGTKAELASAIIDHDERQE